MIHFTPGPSQLYPTVPQHIQLGLENHIGSLSHRSGKFKDIFSGTVEGLRTLLSIPKDPTIIFLPSATEGMERVLQGVVNKESYHITTGSFGEKFKEIAQDLGKKAVTYSLDVRTGLQIPEIPDSAELLCFTQNETSNGSWIPLEMIYSLHEKYPEKLLALDIVSSVPYVDVDFQKIDIAFFSVQKGFGLPAGLGVLVLSPRAIERAVSVKNSGKNVGSYHSLLSLTEYAKKFQTPETPNVLGIYLLGKVVEDMNKKGIQNIRKETEQKAKMLYDFFEESSIFNPVILRKEFRSPTVLVASVKEAVAVHEKVVEQDMVIGKGYGAFKDQHIRIANFPAHTINDVRKLITFL